MSKFTCASETSSRLTGMKTLLSFLLLGAAVTPYANAQTELVSNGGFESGLSSWTAFWGTGIQATLTTYPHAGSHYAYLTGDGAVGGIYQNVAIPANASSATLSFWWNVSSLETTSTTPYDDFFITIYDSSGTTSLALVQTLSNLDKSTAGEYQRTEYNLAAFIGQTIRVRMNGQNDASLNTVFRIDDVSVQLVVAPTAHTLTVLSSNPDSGANMGISPNDVYGQNGGSTPFTRTYNHNTTIILNASPDAGGNIFQKWVVDGVDAGTSTYMDSLIMNADHTVTAVYGTTPPPVRTLTVNSTNPSSGLSVSVSPSDRSGRSSGVTPFALDYDNNAFITLTAPQTSGVNEFQKWQRDGADISLNREVPMFVTANHVLTAIYSPTVNQRPGVTSLSTPGEARSGDIVFSYTLADTESDPCGILAEYSPDGGSTWRQAMNGSGGDGTTTLAASLGGTAHTFVWASGSDIVNANNPAVKLRITPSDSGGAGTSDTTETFTVNNTTATLIVTPNTATSYGSLLVGGAKDLSFNVENVGTTPISGAVSICAPFLVVSGGSYTLGSGKFATTTIRYAPTTAGNHSVTATFTGGSGTTLKLTGSAATDPTPTTGSIVGQVTRADTHAVLNNVLITATGPRGSSSTRSGVLDGQAGRYSLTALPASTHYQVSATADGQPFQITEIDEVSVIVGQTTALNIEMMPSDAPPEPSPENTPVVLVRGFGPDMEWVEDDSNSWSWVRSALVSNGFTNVWDCNQPEVGVMGDGGHVINGENGILYNAEMLKHYLRQKAERYRTAHGGHYPPKVHVVAHSMGGLIVRAALGPTDQLISGLHVGKVVMLATPHCGSPVVENPPNWFWNWMLSRVDPCSARYANMKNWGSAHDLSPSRMRTYNVGHQWPSVPLYIVSATDAKYGKDKTWNGCTDWGAVGGKVILDWNKKHGINGTDEDTNDSAVTRPSANGLYWTRDPTDWYRPQPPPYCVTNIALNPVQSISDLNLGARVDHLYILKHEGVTNWLVNTLLNPAPTPTSVPYPDGAGSAIGSMVARPTAAAVEQQTVRLFESVDDTVTNGMVIAQPVTSDATTTLTFELVASDSNIILRLSDPSGMLIDADAAQSNACVQCTTDLLAQNLLETTFTITVPTTGVYLAMIDAGSLMATNATYSLTVYGDSGVGLSPQTPNVFEQGEDAVMSSLFADLEPNPVEPVVNASMSAMVQLPDGTTTNLCLVDDGWHRDGAPNDGIYAAVLSNLQQAGTYSITYRAIGTNAQGRALQRVASGGFSVSSGHGGVLGDPAYESLDTDGNGISEVLLLKCWVNPTAAGKFNMVGTLIDESGTRRFTKSSLFASDGSGPTLVTLVFDLVEMRSAGSQSSYHIENLQLFEVTDLGTDWLDIYRGTSAVDINGPKAVTPTPNDQGADVARPVVLQWANGGESSSFDVYFGPDENSLVFRTNQTDTTFDPGVLACGMTYYWRIDARNAEGTAQGDIWSFTTEPPFLYEVSGEAITITGYVGDGGDVAIPDMINGLPVTSIGALAFYSCTTLTSVAIPNSVTSIGEGAFQNCLLASISIPSSVASIGRYAFSGCGRLSSFTIPDSITSIGPGVFQYCSSLARVTIPNSIITIGDSAFMQCSSLISLTIPSSVTRIDAYAFLNCEHLISVYFEGDAPFVGEWVFNYPLPTLYYQSGTIGWGATFAGCPAFPFPFNYTINPDNTIIITAYTGSGGIVRFPDRIVGLQVGSIGANAFSSCANLISITIPGSVTNIGNCAFQQCTNLTSVYFEGNAPSVGGDLFDGTFPRIYYLSGTTGWMTTFAGCPAFLVMPFNYTMNPDTTVNITGYSGSGGDLAIPDTLYGMPVASIGDYAFCLCNLTSVTVPDSITGIGYGAFQQCASLTNVTLGAGVNSIGLRAFAYCDQMTSIQVDPANPVYSSLDGILFNKDRTVLIECPTGFIGEFSIPNGVTNIADLAFDSCSLLSGVTIPDSVIRIGDGAFGGCALSRVLIPSSVTSIGSSAFGCDWSLAAIDVDVQNPVYCSLDGVLFNKDMTVILEYPPGGASVYSIPNGVTNVGDSAFALCAVVDVTIPDGVTRIGDHAFQRCPLESITIPDSVTEIGVWAFNDCYSLSSVLVGNGVRSIGDYAFYCTPSLTEITIPSSVGSIGHDVFGNCLALTSVYFLGDAPAIPEGSPDVFYGADNVTVYYYFGTSGWGDTYCNRPTVALTPDFSYTSNGSAITITDYSGPGGDVIIPATIDGLPVESVGDIAFWKCTNLVSVIIPDSVISIGDGAFWKCPNLLEVTIGNGVAYIGDGAFFECTSLTLVSFSGDAPACGDFVFDGDYQAGVYCTPDTFGWEAFFGGLRVHGIEFTTEFNTYDTITITGYLGAGGSVVIPETIGGYSVTSIGDSAFYYCQGVSDVTIPDSVNFIEDTAFYSCRGLTNVTIPDSVTWIGYGAFDGCSSLASVTIPDSVTHMGVEVFAHTGLTNVIIGAGVACIEGGAFDNCRELASVSFSTGITSIGYYAFRQCYSLVDVTIPNSVTGLVFGAFYYCTGLTNVVIGSGVSVIDDYVFNDCTALDNITVDGDNPTFSSVNGVLFDKSLSNLIQYPCGRCGGYVVPDGVQVISAGAFGSCAGLTSISICDGVSSIGDWAFQFCDGLTYVTMPDSITHIGDGAFNSCSSLSGLYFRGAPPTEVNLYGNDYNTIVYYRPDVTGWSTDLDGWPTLPWDPQVQAGPGFGLDAYGLFGFTVLGTGTMAVAVEACTSLTDSAWSPVSVFSLSGGTGDFTDAASTNYPARFYRLRMP